MSSEQSNYGEQLAIAVEDPPPRSALTESCPKCGAIPDLRCVTDAGTIVFYEHLARRRMTAYVPLGRCSS